MNPALRHLSPADFEDGAETLQTESGPEGGVVGRLLRTAARVLRMESLRVSTLRALIGYRRGRR